MSESHATTSVFLSCAAARRPAASPAAPIPAVTRKSRRFMSAPSVRDLFGPEKDVLRPLQIVPVELAHQLLARGGRDVPLILVHVTDLDPLDVAPARRLGAVDGPLDAMGAIAHDAGQRSRHHVVVLPQPALVVLALDARLERRDHVPYRHRPSLRLRLTARRPRRRPGVRSSRARRPAPAPRPARRPPGYARRATYPGRHRARRGPLRSWSRHGGRGWSGSPPRAGSVGACRSSPRSPSRARGPHPRHDLLLEALDHHLDLAVGRHRVEHELGGPPPREAD